ncbi:MAG: hypothetical protein ABSG68_19345 [Thermoguttaceae bacterium]
MTRHLVFFAVVIVLSSGAARADQSSWIFRPSYFSHSPETGQRVAQYQPEAPAYVRNDDTYQESGYRHNEASIQVGGQRDHLHVVQTWGQGELIRPYGEWLFPYRAGATPYGPWGNPQGPWTLPQDSWQNPYGPGRQFQQPWQAQGPGQPAQMMGAAPPAMPGPAPIGQGQMGPMIGTAPAAAGAMPGPAPRAQ